MSDAADNKGTTKPIVSLDDFHALAKKKLDKVDYDYYANGAEDERTLRANYSAWEKVRVWPRFCHADMTPDALNLKFNVDGKSSASFGSAVLKMPTMVCPMAMQKLAHYDGEVGL